MLILRGFLKGGTVLEANQIQTAASAGESLGGRDHLHDAGARAHRRLAGLRLRHDHPIAFTAACSASVYDPDA